MRRLLASLGLLAVLMIGLALVANTWTSGTAMGEDKGKPTPTEGPKPTEPHDPKPTETDGPPKPTETPDPLKDSDKDGLPDVDDNCPYHPNPDQANADGDEHGDACDKDDDNDGVPDEEEGKHGTDPDNPNTDKDACTDGQELGDDETKGGMRDPTNPWDFFDPSGDGKNRVLDIVIVADQYFIDAGDDKYTESTDRTLEGPYDWSLDKGNGEQRVDDIIHEVEQFFHDCK